MTTSAMIGVFRFGGGAAADPELGPIGLGTRGIRGRARLVRDRRRLAAPDGPGGTAAPCSRQGSAGSAYGSSELPPRPRRAGIRAVLRHLGFLRARSIRCCHRSVRRVRKPRTESPLAVGNTTPAASVPAATVHGRVATPRDLRGRSSARPPPHSCRGSPTGSPSASPTPPRRRCAICSRPFPPGPARMGTRRSRVPVRRGLRDRPWPPARRWPRCWPPRSGRRRCCRCYLLAAVLGLLLALIDLRCLRLPDRLVGALALAAVVPLTVLRPERVGPAVLAAWAVLIAYAGRCCLCPERSWPRRREARRRAGRDPGLRRLAGGARRRAGPHLINGPIALFLLISRRAGGERALPFGPALLAGALIGLTAV